MVMDRRFAKFSATTALFGLALLAQGCAAPVPVPDPAEAAPQFSERSGLVIGTVSYQYAERQARQRAPLWVVHFERIDGSARPQDYAMVVSMDPQTQSGVFSGPLPAGVYTFREAEAAQQRYLPGAFRMPFEVQAGAVQDAGHYAVSPVQASAMRARWNSP